jgi:hypothetical protein
MRAVFPKVSVSDSLFKKQPVKAGQEFIRSDNGVQHALCFYDSAYAKRVLRSKTEH